MDRSIKREIVEMVHNAFSSDPLTDRRSVCERVMREMQGRPELMERAQQVSVFHMLETITGEYVRRTRARIKGGILSGQANIGAEGPPPYEVVNRVRLTIPVGNGEYEDKPALLCSLEEIRAARLYYSEQKRAIDKREKYCAAIQVAMLDRGLSEGQIVADLYKAA